MAKLFRGREGVALVGRPPDFKVLCEDWDGPLTTDQIAKLHLTGEVCLGSTLYAATTSAGLRRLISTTKPSVPIKSKVKAVARCLAKAHVDYRVARSQSGRGFHVLIFFSEAVPAWMARRFLKGVVEKAGIGDPEIFPTQDVVPEGKLGNAIRLPLFNKSRFVQPLNAWTEQSPLDALTKVRRLSKAELTAAAARLGIDLALPQKPTPVRRPNSRSKSDAKAAQIPNSVKKLLANPLSLLARRWNGDSTGLRDQSQSGLVMAIACSLAARGIATEVIKVAIRAWCSANGYKKGERPDWVVLTVQKAEQFVASHRRSKPLIRSQVAELANSFSEPIARLIRKSIRRR